MAVFFFFFFFRLRFFSNEHFSFHAYEPLNVTHVLKLRRFPPGRTLSRFFRCFPATAVVQVNRSCFTKPAITFKKRDSSVTSFRFRNKIKITSRWMAFVIAAKTNTDIRKLSTKQMYVISVFIFYRVCLATHWLSKKEHVICDNFFL